MAESTNLKISPEAMNNKAAQLEKEIQKIEKEWGKIGETILRSKNYWESDASNIHQKAYVKVKANVEQVIKRLKEHPKDLRIMAGVYTKAENEATQIAKVLPDNVIN